ncbi:MAG TPA: di-trans,poly-cis-decaprenylcistransferase [Methanomicrobia archaeon]|nr:Undecaprenyl pyrophosphate synthase [Candidatus Alkanophaga volatiphilum]HDO63781.1 di-trans,poly-cis-decaprenylcistransferase [Methanomicrobia archaeon]HEX59374.1 di-trans,poly-cis-decaprenylcistransferase [Methanomicrobia archaeon]
MPLKSFFVRLIPKFVFRVPFLERFIFLASRMHDALQAGVYASYERLLEEEIKEGKIPRHVAIIMDGNRRYAEKIGEARHKGHYYGAEVTERVIEWCFDLGVKQLTLYTFSIENFNRSEEEKRELFRLIKEKFDDVCQNERIHEKKIRVRAVGELQRLPEDLRRAIEAAEAATAKYTNFTLNIAIAYSGRREIVEAARCIAEKVKRGELDVEDIDEDVISRHLRIGSAAESGNGGVDLIIRTGGELRLSNFIPWQALGNECAAYFCAPYWPEFRKIDLLRAIRTFQQREAERRRSTMLRALKLAKICGDTLKIKGLERI